MPHIRKALHPWPTRRIGHTKRYRVLVDGVWISTGVALAYWRYLNGYCRACWTPRAPGSSEFCAKHHLARRLQERSPTPTRPCKPDTLIGPGPRLPDSRWNPVRHRWERLVGDQWLSRQAVHARPKKESRMNVSRGTRPIH